MKKVIFILFSIMFTHLLFFGEDGEVYGEAVSDDEEISDDNLPPGSEDPGGEEKPEEEKEEKGDKFEPVPYSEEEFAPALNKLRRAEIVFAGSLPISFLYTTVVYRIYRRFAKVKSKEWKRKEKIGVIIAGVSLSATVTLMDYIIGKVHDRRRRKKKEMEEKKEQYQKKESRENSMDIETDNKTGNEGEESSIPQAAE